MNNQERHTTTPKRRSWLGRVIHITGSSFMWGVTLVASLGLLVSAWGGQINPEGNGRFGVIVMTLPFWIPVMLVTLCVNAVFFKRQALMSGIVLAMCLPRVCDIYPVGIGINGERADEHGRSWTLMTYNCAALIDLTEEYLGGLNPTYRIIMDANADLVCLQECDGIEPREYVHIDSAQVDSLSARYPYLIQDDINRMALLSRYPARELKLSHRGYDRGDGEIAAYEIDMGKDRQLLLVSVHLQSIGLTDADKQFYGELTEPSTIEQAEERNGARSLVGRIRTDLASKLSMAGQHRARQARLLASYIERYGRDNVIVCGDFNDVPGCYTLTLLESLGLRQVYSAVGRGYMATFNRDKLWFRIDHVMWRGNLIPRDIKRIESKTSDHYPVITRFVWR
ncbi:MAG: endonuclease/exonuclease/phosphatase family protein [Muribaculaceae bacterium]|nr:endonuclease/exonuclease/phosphatase family protein [Muribaculaceae bacterium]